MLAEVFSLEYNVILPLLIILVLALIFIIVWYRREIKHTKERIKDEYEAKFNEWKEKEERSISNKAIKRSSAARTGKYVERLVPFLADFKHDSGDLRWLGDPIDYIIFEGYRKSKDSKDINELNKIILCEVKKDEKASLTKEQKRIKQLIEEKKVDWEVYIAKK